MSSSDFNVDAEVVQRQMRYSASRPKPGSALAKRMLAWRRLNPNREGALMTRQEGREASIAIAVVTFALLAVVVTIGLLVH